jgi:hypothetical protein
MVAQRDGKDRVDQLPRQAYLCGWPTPTRTDSVRTPSQNFTTHNITLNHAALFSGWPTPQASDSTGGGQACRAMGGDTARLQSERLCNAGSELPGPVNGIWRSADWLTCRDGKWRPVEPGTFPLADGAPARVGRLRAYGNAINAEQARIFIESVMEAT